MRAELCLEDLLGRQVHAADNRRAGRIEEFRAQWNGAECTITGLVIGAAGWYERLGLGARLLAGQRRHGRVARWDQVDITDPKRPRLTCAIEELEPL